MSPGPMSDLQPSARAAAEVLTTMSRKRLKPTHESEVIDLTGPDDPSPRLVQQTRIDIEDDDEIEIVDPPPQVTPVKTEAVAHHGDDDVQVTGTVNAMQLPHMRPHCTNYLFVPHNSQSNSQSCHLCYCYVCDVPVNECRSWPSHCSATDQGPKAFYWKTLRRAVNKNETTILEVRFSCAKLFRSLFQTFGKFVKKACLVFHGSGMKCKANASKGTAFLSLSLSRDFFSRYFRATDNVDLHLNVADLTRALKNANSDSHETVVLKATRCVLTVTVERGETSEETQIPLRNRRDPLTYPPVGLRQCRCNISTAEFKGVIDAAHKLRAPTNIAVPSSTASKQTLSFWIPRVMERRALRVKRLEAITSENDSLEKFEQNFRTQLLFQFTRSRPTLATNVSLSLSANHPMQVEYGLKGDDERCIGRFKLHLWPINE